MCQNAITKLVSILNRFKNGRPGTPGKAPVAILELKHKMNTTVMESADSSGALQSFVAVCKCRPIKLISLSIPWKPGSVSFLLGNTINAK